MGSITKLFGMAWRFFVGSIYWFSTIFTTIILTLASYHMIMNTATNLLQFQLWAFTFFIVSMTGIWWYFRFFKPQRWITGVIKLVNFVIVVVLVVAIFFALFFAAVIATTDLAHANLSAAETLLQREFWDATWLSAQWRQDVLWNESAWTNLITQALIDVNWWQQEVLPWAIEQVKLHVALADRLTGASIFAATIAPFMGLLLSAGGILRVGLPLISKALGAGFISKMVQMALVKMQRKFDHIPDQDIAVTPKIAVFKEFRRAGVQRGKLGDRLLHAVDAFFAQLDELPDGELKKQAHADAHRFLDVPVKNLKEALLARFELVHEINQCLQGYNQETRELKQKIKAATDALSVEEGGFLKRWPFKKALKKLEKELAEVNAKYDGKTVYSKILSRKQGAFKVPGIFQTLYPDYAAHEKNLTIPAISELWGQLGDIETEMSVKYGIRINALDDMQQMGILSSLKEMLKNFVTGRRKQNEQVELMKQQLQQQGKQIVLLKDVVVNLQNSSRPQPVKNRPVKVKRSTR